MIKKIMSQVICPLETDTGIFKVIKHCLLNNGQETSHSRNIKLDDNYRKPLNGNLSSDEAERIEILGMLQVLKIFASKYLNGLKSKHVDLSFPVATYYPEIFDKEITGKDLEFIISHTYDELKECNNSSLSKLLHIYFKFGGLSAEHFSSDCLYEDSSYDEGEIGRGYSKRIYMNLPRNSSITYEFGLLFVQKCIEYGIPFDMKLLGSLSHNDNDLDGSVFYSKNKYFSKHLEILHEILIEHPEYKKYIGTPIYTGGQIVDDDGKTYMTISHSGGKIPTYNDAVDRIINYAYVSCCSQIIGNNLNYFRGKFDSITLEHIKKWSSLESLNSDLLSELGSNIKILFIIREQFYNFVLFKQKNGELKDLLSQMEVYMKDSIKVFSSLINFGDLEHTKEPIYKDPSFIIYEKNYLSSSTSFVEDKKKTKDLSELKKVFISSSYQSTSDIKSKIIALIKHFDRTKISNQDVIYGLHTMLETIIAAKEEELSENDVIECQKVLSSIKRLSFVGEKKIINDIEEFNNRIISRKSHKR